MTAATARALALLREEQLTCVVCGKDEAQTFKSRERGVAPLLNWLDNGMRFPAFSAADKVVGAGAAYLYVLLGVTELYALTVSKNAQTVLQQYGITLFCDTLVPHIVNRAGDGPCPIEQAVADATDPADALCRIRARLAALRAAKPQAT